MLGVAYLRFDWHRQLLAAIRPDRAIADYDEVVRPEPAFALAYHDCGVAWRDKGDAARARVDFQTAVVIDPTLDTASEHLTGSERQVAHSRK
jgi:hypothetical protein